MLFNFHFKRGVAFLVLAVFLTGFIAPVPSYAEAETKSQSEYDPLHTMLALNMAIVSIHRIITTQDKIVMNQEYDNIINKLALGNIESDYDITGLYSEVMNFITGRLIRQEDMRRVQEKYNRRGQRQIVEAVSGIRAYGGNFWSWLGSLAVSCVSQYFSYQNAKEELHEGLDEELWLLKKDDIEQCNELQVKLLNSSWNLLRQYRLPDEYRLTQDSLDGFYGALNEPDPVKRLRRLQVRTIERNFQAYPPYWFFRAKAAQELNQGEEAAKCYAKFNEIWRPVLRRDPYKLEAEKYAVLILTKDPDINKDEIKKHLAAIQENLADDDWSNNLFAGVVYFLLGGKNDKAEAIKLLEDNVIAERETDVSGVILRQMEAGRLNPESLPRELKNVFQAFEKREKLIAQAEDRKLASALSTYFEGDEKAGEAALERLSENSENPVVFRALAIIEKSRKSTHLDYKKITQLEMKEENLRKSNMRHYEAARPLLEHYAEQGSDLAMMLLGYMYLYGFGVEKNYDKALKLFSAPAENGNVYAQTSMGAVHYYRRDYSQSLKWHRKAAERNYANAQRMLGIMYDNGQGVEQDYKKAVEWHRKAAEQGYAYAQFNLGLMYVNGQGLEQDYKKAFEWWQKAAEQGLAGAQFNLGFMYDNGQGVAQDYKKAVEWYRKAAEQGLADAQYNLGGMYVQGQGVEQDYKKAVEWYRKAAEQGNASAQFILGVMYRNGDRVEQDYKKAVEWWQKAAEQGHVDAQFSLGVMYKNGQGVEQDYKKAVEWYRKAAEQGHAYAQFNLGGMYEYGYGVAKDLRKAREWYQKAASQGNEYAKKELERLGR